MPTAQPHLPGEDFEPTPAQKALQPAIEEYVTHRDARIAAGAQEKDAKIRLVGLMEFHNIRSIKVGRHLCYFEDGEPKLKVKVADEEDYTDDGEGGPQLKLSEDEDE